MKRTRDSNVKCLFFFIFLFRYDEKEGKTKIKMIRFWTYIALNGPF